MFRPSCSTRWTRSTRRRVRQVAKALMDKVYEFGRKHGMESVVGPLGFTDFDPEGMLVEGFDRMGTMPLIYNYPYYNDYLADMGFEKDADWVELHIQVPTVMPERWPRLSEIIQKRTNVHMRELTRSYVRKEKYGEKIFALINTCYKNLYNFTVLPDHMAKKYLDFYLSVLDLKFVSMVENENNELIAFGITMRSGSTTKRASNGAKRTPFWRRIPRMQTNSASSSTNRRSAAAPISRSLNINS